jgi:MFS transporter, DHA1 family, multidrug resistance protein
MVHRNIQLVLIVASFVLNMMATNILLPCLPQIAVSFSVSPNDAKMLISIFLIGQFSTALLWGIIADQIGKRQTLLIGMLVFFVGSVISLKTTSMPLFLFSRFLQGVGGVVVPVAGWALVQDLFLRSESARIMAWIGMLFTIIPLFAPALGGKIQVLYSWHVNLYCITSFSAALCLCMLFLPKSSIPPIHNQGLDLKSRLNIYGTIVKNKTFLSYIALFGLLNCGEWCFLTVAPFYYAHIQISPDIIGILFMLIAIGFVLGSLLASILMKHIGIDKTIQLGIQLSLFSSLMLLGGEYMHFSTYQMFNTITIGLYVLGSALLWGGTTSRALQCFDYYRSSASAVRSLIVLCFAAFGTYSGRLLNHTSLYPIGFFLLFVSVCALLVFYNRELTAERLSGKAAYSG